MGASRQRRGAARRISLREIPLATVVDPLTLIMVQPDGDAEASVTPLYEALQRWRETLGSETLEVLELGSLSDVNVSGVAGTDLLGYNATTELWEPVALATLGGTFLDNVFLIKDDVDNTKQLAFQLDQITTLNLRTLTIPDADGTIVTREGVDGSFSLYGSPTAYDDITIAPNSGDESAASGVNPRGDIYFGVDGTARFIQVSNQGGSVHNEPERIVLGGAEPGTTLKGVFTAASLTSSEFTSLTGYNAYWNDPGGGSHSGEGIGQRDYWKDSDGTTVLGQVRKAELVSTTNTTLTTKYTIDNSNQLGNLFEAFVLDGEGLEIAHESDDDNATRRALKLSAWADSGINPAIGFGLHQDFDIQPNNHVLYDPKTAARIRAEWTDITDTTETAALIISTMTGGTLTDVVNIRNDHVHIGVNPVDLDTLDVDGSIFLTHTALEPDDHALELDVDADGNFDVKAVDIDYITGSLAADQEEGVILINIDETDATGGDIWGLEMLATEGGADLMAGLFVGGGIGPIEQLSGVFSDPDTVDDTGSDILATVGQSPYTGGEEVFTNDDDTLVVGDDGSQFAEIELLYGTGASGGGIQPKFEFSTHADATPTSTTGGHWTEFGPTDGTNGARNSGVIAFIPTDLSGWIQGDGGGGSGTTYMIRITRQRNSLTTPPVLDKAQVLEAAVYYWNKTANVVALDFNGVALTTGGAATDFLSGDGTYGVPGGGVYLPLAGGTLTGNLVVDGADIDIESTTGLLTFSNDAGTRITEYSAEGVEAAWSFGQDYQVATDDLLTLITDNGSIVFTAPFGTISANGVDIEDRNTHSIHDDIASEISAVTAKGTPTTSDFLLIEDAAAGNAKKRVTIGSLPSSGGMSDLIDDLTPQLGGNLDINGKLVDGITPSNHQARHIPGGADALQVSTDSFLGRGTAGTGDVEELTPEGNHITIAGTEVRVRPLGANCVENIVVNNTSLGAKIAVAVYRTAGTLGTMFVNFAPNLSSAGGSATYTLQLRDTSGTIYTYVLDGNVAPNNKRSSYAVAFFDNVPHAGGLETYTLYTSSSRSNATQTAVIGMHYVQNSF